MHFFTIQSIFLFYSAISIFCGLLLIGFFWGRKDLSARIWILSCFLSALATMVTVYRDRIPLQVSYSLMVSIETLALLLLGQSLWNLLPGYKAIRGFFRVLTVVAVFLLFQEALRFLGDGKLTPAMSLLTSSTWVFVDLFCAYSAYRVAKQFQHKLFLQIIAIVFFSSSVLFAMRLINMLTGNAYSAFDPQTFNFIIYFGIAILSTFRNLLYIFLRMHLGFAEHSRLNNMNMRLNNVVEERNQMINSLAKLNKSAEVNALASTVAHEVNQPLGASKLDAQFALHIMKEQPENVAALQGAVQSLVDNIDRASNIIRNLSNLSRKSSLEHEQIALSQLLIDVVQISKGRCSKLGIQIEYIAEQDIKVFANSGELQQVLINLINNAIDELEIAKISNGKILIFAKQVGRFVRIFVQDNGRGVPKDKEKSIFELLHSDKDGGSGIGLWLSQSILTRWNGRLWFESAPQGGAIFIVELAMISK
jgi:signal transduction histidine kinase